MIRVSAQQKSFLSAQEQLQVMMLPAPKRKRIIQKLNRHLVKTNRQNIRANKDPDGKQWKARKSGSKKMMQKMAKQMRSKADSHQGTIFFPGIAGVIAAKQHHGFTEKWDAAKAEKVYGNGDQDGPPTRAQAKRLRELGYKKPGKKKRKPQSASLKWIIENLTSGQVGLIIRMMKDKQSKVNWETVSPARPLLGAKSEDVAESVSKSLKEERR